MKGNYIFEYFDEIKFKKCERSLKKYNMFAFKKLIFEFYPKMKEGEFLGVPEVSFYSLNLTY